MYTQSISNFLYIHLAGGSAPETLSGRSVFVDLNILFYVPHLGLSTFYSFGAPILGVYSVFMLFLSSVVLFFFCLALCDIRLLLNVDISIYFFNVNSYLLVSLCSFLFLLSTRIDNPLHCSCDSQELWEWLKDHRKWISVGDSNKSFLKCEQPIELRGRIFTQMEPQDFCELPLIAKLAIQDIQPFSVVVSWQKREHSGLNGFEVKYQQIDADIADVSR